jgi:hypothetical protein
MHKFPIPIAHDPPAPKQTRLRRAAAMIVLGLGVAPLLGEGAAMCYTQWCQVVGKNASAQTPVFDSLNNGINAAHQSFWDALTPLFRRLPWNPRIVFAVAIIAMVLGMMMLRM